jgi:DinB superfamily
MAISRSLQQTIDTLALFPKQLAQLFDCFSSEQWNWRPQSWDGIPSEKLTALEQICHVFDVELEGYRIRFERTRTESTPVLPDLPGEQMAAQRNYAASDAAVVLRNFASARSDTVQAIRRFTAEEFDRAAIFEGKRTTLAGLVHFLSSHDYQHLSGLQWLLAKAEGVRGGH